MILMRKSSRDSLLQFQKSSTYQLFLVAGITLLATALRFYRLGNWSFWIDEILTLERAIDPHYYYTVSPKLSGILIKLSISLLGVNEFSTRFFPALFGLVTVPLLYLFVKKEFSVFIASLSSIILTILPIVIFYSQNARYYSALMFFYLIALFAFYYWVNKRQTRYLLIAVLFLVLAFSERTFSLFLVPSAIFYLIIVSYINARINYRQLAGIILIPAVIYVFYELFRVYVSGEPLLLKVFYSNFVGEANMRPEWLISSFVEGELTIPVAILAFIGSVFSIKERDQAGLLLASSAFIPVFLLVLMSFVAKTYTRYLLITLPSWCILAAIGIERLYRLVRDEKYIVRVLLFGGVVWLFSATAPVFTDAYYFWQRGVQNIVILFVFLASVSLFIWFLMLLVSIFGRRKILTANFAFLEKYRGFLVISSLLTPLILYPAFMDSLYFAVQHGYRDNFKEVASLISEHADTDDKIVVHHTLVKLGDYYFATEPFDEESLISLLDDNQDVWVVEEFGIANTRIEQKAFSFWASTKCELIASSNQFVLGKDWSIRLHHCLGSGTIATDVDPPGG